MLAQLLHPWCGRYLPPQLAAVARPATKEYSAEAMKRPQHEVVAAAQAAAEEELEQQGADGAAESDEDEEVRRTHVLIWGIGRRKRAAGGGWSCGIR